MLGIVVSRADEASVAIGEQLRTIADWEAETDADRADADGGATVYRTEGAVIREFEELHLDLVRPADAFDGVDCLVFVSKHAGETGRLLTAHHTGNFGPADHGGDPNALARAIPGAHGRVLEALATHAPDDYDVGMECTHHGPTDVGAPSMFVEVGSGPQQWADERAARAVARAVLDLRGVAPDREPVTDDGTRRHLVGFGGGHYAPQLERVVRETDWAVGHVAADWGLDALGEMDDEAARAVIDAAFTESAASHALVTADRDDVAAVVRDLGYRVVGETWLRETTGVSLDLVRRLEHETRPVADGLRFGEIDTDQGEWVTASLPTALLKTARGIDQDATLAAVRERSVAYTTDQGGSRPTETVVLATEDARRDILEDLADVLRQRYDAVEWEGDDLVARETVFDPERAATLGVPEGPKFGRLAAGESVEVGGETIPPSAVSETRDDRFTCR